MDTSNPIDTSTPRDTHELARRTNAGTDVRLLWNALSNRLCVTVDDDHTGAYLEITVKPGDRALDVYHHPYAYAGAPRLG
jgi:YD repeat-containing protein